MKDGREASVLPRNVLLKRTKQSITQMHKQKTNLDSHALAVIVFRLSTPGEERDNILGHLAQGGWRTCHAQSVIDDSR